MPPICWGAADTEGAESAGALPPGRGIEARDKRGEDTGGWSHVCIGGDKHQMQRRETEKWRWTVVYESTQGWKM